MRDPRETACPLYFNLARPLLDTNIIQLGIVSRRPSEGRGRGLRDLHTDVPPGLYFVPSSPRVANDSAQRRKNSRLDEIYLDTW